MSRKLAAHPFILRISVGNNAHVDVLGVIQDAVIGHRGEPRLREPPRATRPVLREGNCTCTSARILAVEVQRPGLDVAPIVQGGVSSVWPES